MNIRRTNRGVGGAGISKHTRTHSVPRYTQGEWSLGQGSDGLLTHESVVHPPIISMVYEHREYVVGGGGAGNSKHRQTHTQSVHRDTQGGLNLGQ